MYARNTLGDGFRVWGSGFRIQGLRVRIWCGAGRRVQGSGFRVQGSGFRVQGLLSGWGCLVDAGEERPVVFEHLRWCGCRVQGSGV